MIQLHSHPLVYEINARQLCLQNGKDGNLSPLSAIPDKRIARWQALGFNAVWVMGVWTTGKAAQKISQEDTAFTKDYAVQLPDWKPEDIIGSPYSIQHYQVHPDFGGKKALQALRRKLAKYNMGLILDFVPNHTAPDHPWVKEHPDFYVQTSQESYANDPQNITQINERYFAYGRDPYFPGWKDTLQLDYRNPQARKALIATLLDIASQCDGLRCDMAMLVLSEIFEKTWGKRDGIEFPEGYQFWAEAIDAVREKYPKFVFAAEAYWGLEWRLQSLGFDYTYNKSVYDTMAAWTPDALARQIWDAQFQQHSVQFIENHDEPRAATTWPDPKRRRAAAFLALTLPGMRLIHDGQCNARKLHASVHLARRADEPVDDDEHIFYEHLLSTLKESVVGQGEWQLLTSQQVRDSDTGFTQIIAYLWTRDDGARDLIVMNLSEHSQDARIPITSRGLAGRKLTLQDRLSNEKYERQGDPLVDPGLYVRLKAFQLQIFKMGW